MISEKLKLELENIFSEYEEIDKIVLFGSRARDDYRVNSDVDIKF
ncbi:hypothetical protein GCM10008904_23840 [Paraclostridium ghonii]|uniref:Nucleotidyltransferase n=1 Tax=Paraclostridium ghonii TaxID=29358 RepID=A0ABU0N4C0_9FIRM|nr:nucleotidyltransferase domain-containing protein [Paeniclostridium ghonii]MDQ0557829.1 putative nucleotidyltransferase [Paeniclostridium ghonii]